MVQKYERCDWHNYDFMNYEAGREGNGEQGKGHFLTNSSEIALDKELEKEEGLHVLVSDKISINRSLPDTRPKELVKLTFSNLHINTILIVDAS